MPLSLPIYLDYMATTPVDPRVVEAMTECLKNPRLIGNSSSASHRYGFEALECIEEARKHVSALLNADPREIVWTSGATESDNLAIQGAAYFYQRQGKHLITMSTEHKAVLDACGALESRGFEVTYLDPEPNGLLNLQKLEDAIRRDTLLVSIMHVNNETGVIQDIPSIAEIVKKRGTLFHVDATQGAGKLPIDLKEWPVDLMSVSAHKIYGPKGIGALYVRREPRVRLEPLIRGGGHERGLRSGTLATHQIMGMGKAFELAKQHLISDAKQITRLRDQLWKGLSALGGVHLNGDSSPRIPGCLNITFEDIDAETLLLNLPELALSSSAACTSSNLDPSHVLLAMGLSRENVYRSVRISFGRFTTEKEIGQAIDLIGAQVKRLRG